MTNNTAFIIISYNTLLDNICMNGLWRRKKRIMETVIKGENFNRTIISVKGVKKAFGEVQALRGVDFELQVGQVMGLLGYQRCRKDDINKNNDNVT